MTSLIKQQIIKHLSKFARNITPSQISVQILSGKGELKDIELNEIVLAEVLELPAWLRIKRARCNRVAVKVPWTRLKSSPVQLFVDEIHVDVELTSDGPVSSGTNLLSSFADSSYGFANRVVEGMSLYVNTVEIDFDSGVFGGSLMLSRLSVESKSPGWQTISDLRSSRIVDPTTNQLLMFKQVTWQLLRIEASAQVEPSQRTKINAPLRLIISNGKSRIAVKKSTNDGSVISGRIQTILEDILWVATLPQVRSALAFYSHIMSLVKAAPKKTHFHMPMKPSSSSSQSQSQSQQSQTMNSSRSSNLLASKAFRNFDFDQTSYHLYVGKIDLHLCDDTNTPSGYPSDWDIVSGALQVTLMRLSIDIYPSNLAASDRQNWLRYTAPNQCSTWIQQILKAHHQLLCSKLDENAQNRLSRIWPQLLSQNCIIRIYDVIIQCVTDMCSTKESLFNLFASDRKSKTSLPADQHLLHLEFTSFYHPATDTMPMPPNATHLLVGPFSFLLDQRTIRWVLYVYEDISNALRSLDTHLEIDNIPKSDIRIDLLMPKVIIALGEQGTADCRMPRRLMISMSAVLITNSNIVMMNNENCSFFYSLSTNILDFVADIQMPFNQDTLSNFIIHLNEQQITPNADNYWNDEERFWISTSPMWIDTDRGEATRSTPLLGDVAFHAVAHISSKEIQIAIQPKYGGIRAVIDHFQYIQLTRLLTNISLFVDQLEADRKFFSAQRNDGNISVPIIILCLIDQIELNLILSRDAIRNPYELHEQGVEVEHREHNRREVPLPQREQPRQQEEQQQQQHNNASSPSPSSSSISGAADDPLNREHTPVADSIWSAPPVISLPSRNDFGTFPDFLQSNDSELNSAMDEVMSIATNTSDDDQQFIVLDTPEDDVFNNADVVVAEEALTIDECAVKIEQQRQAALIKHVNVLKVFLDSANVAISVINKSIAIEGYSLKVHLTEKMDQLCGEVFKSLNVRSSRQSIESDIGPYKSAQLKFRLDSPADRNTPSLSVQIQGLIVNLSDEIVSHLSPFLLDEDKIETPLNLKIGILRTYLIIKDPKVAFPLKIKLNDCVIEQDDQM